MKYAVANDALKTLEASTRAYIVFILYSLLLVCEVIQLGSSAICIHHGSTNARDATIQRWRHITGTRYKI